jgi:outer membrane autotransporter protein
VLAALVFAFTMTTVSQTQAKNLGPGESDTVYAQDLPQNWVLHGAQLTVETGAQTGHIRAVNQSRVTVNGGRVVSTAQALELVDSEAMLINSSVESAGYGISAVVDKKGSLAGSKVTATGSTISGVGRGISATFNSLIKLSATLVNGSGSGAGGGVAGGGIGVALIGAVAELTDNSRVVGANRGLVMVSDEFVGSNKPSVLLDSSSVVGNNGSAIIVSQGVTPDTQATIEIRNGSTLSGGNGIILEVEKNSTAHFNVDNSALTGNIQVENGSTANLGLRNGSSLTGTITNATRLDVDESSRWIMEDDSSVQTLALIGGMVDLRGTSADFHTLTVNELSGNGTFALGTNLAAGQGDLLMVVGNASGDHHLLVQNSGVDPLRGDDDHQVVSTGGGDATFELVGDKVDFGAFAYELQQRVNGTGGADWYLVQTDEISSGSRTVIGLFSAAPTVWYGESASLRTRMGELRNGNGQGGGWMRSYGNKYNLSAAPGVVYSQTQQGLSFGADGRVSGSDEQWLVGVMGGYSNSDLDLQAGSSGRVDSFYLGAYSTWLAEDGFYIDALIKANRFQNKADVVMRDGEKSEGEYQHYGIGASVEAGKYIKFDADWFVEPFAQVSGLWVAGDDYRLDNGMQARTNGANSLLSRAGTSVGRKYATSDGGFIQPYAKVAVAHEFVGSNQVKVNDHRFANDMSGTRGELGFGVNAQATDKLQLHAGFDYMKGQSIEQPWGVNLGLRYNW